MTTASNKPVAAGRFIRRATTGCLILLMIPAGLMVYFWYWVSHTGRVNSQREEAATISILQGAHRAADGTTRALNASNSNSPDALTGIIWQRTHAPVISYDASRHAYTAIVFRSATYDEEGRLLGGSPGQVDRCFAFTSVRRPGPDWTTEIAERDYELCASSRQVGQLAAMAQDHIRLMHAADLTSAGVAKALDPTHQARTYAVQEVARHGQAITITLLVRDGSNAAAGQQCYGITRHLGAGSAEQSSVAAVPLAASAKGGCRSSRV